MSKQRYIRDEIWDDDWFPQLGVEHKLVWLFLLTNPRCNVAGIYKLNRDTSSATIGVKRAKLDSILQDFEEQNKVMLMDDWVVISNFIKHQSSNPSVKKGIERIIGELPSNLIGFIQAGGRLGTGCPTLLNSTLLNFTLPNGGDPFEPDDKKFSERDMQMAELLTSLIKTNYPDWQMRGNIKTWAAHIEKLHRIDGRTYEQIEYMIRWTQAHEFWRQNILSTSKLREKFNELIPKLREDIAKRQRQAQRNHNPIL